MDLRSLTSGTPSTKPWLNIQAFSVNADSLDVQSVHSATEQTRLLIMEQSDVLPRPDAGVSIVTADTLGRLNVDTDVNREVIAYVSDIPPAGPADEIKAPDSSCSVTCSNGSTVTTTRAGNTVQTFSVLKSTISSPAVTSELDLREIGGGYASLNQNGTRRVLVTPSSTAMISAGGVGRVMAQDAFVMIDNNGDPYAVADFNSQQMHLSKTTTILDHYANYSIASQCHAVPISVVGTIPTPIVQPGYSGSWVFPPNELLPNQVYEVAVSGFFSGFSPPQTVRFRLLCNGQPIADTGFEPTNSGLTTFRTVMTFGIESLGPGLLTQTWSTCENRFDDLITMDSQTQTNFDFQAVNTFEIFANLGIANANILQVKRVIFSKIAG